MPKKKTLIAKTKGTVTVVNKQNGVTVDEKTHNVNLDTTKVDDPSATVSFKLGETINKGNFQSSRIDVGIYIPCKVDELDKTFMLAQTWVTQKLKQELAKLAAEPKPKVLTEEHPF